MSAILTDPLGQSVVVPLIAAILVAGLIRLIGGPGRGALLAGLAIGLGFLACYIAVFGVFAWPPRSAAQKIPYIVVLAMALGVTMDLTRLAGPFARGAIFVGVVGAVWWLFGNKVNLSAPWPLVWPGAAVIAGWLFVLWRLNMKAGDVLTPAVTLLVAAAGLAVIAVLAHTASGGQLAAGLAAATGGFALWNWPVPRFRFGQGAILAGAAALMALTTQFVLFTKVSLWAILVLALVFFGMDVVAGLKLPSGRLRGFVAPVVLGAVCALPALAAVAIAFFSAGPASPY